MIKEKLTYKDEKYGTIEWRKDLMDNPVHLDYLARHKLYELETKIEEGTLIELPCKIGALVYKIYPPCDSHKCPYNGDFGQWRCNYKGAQRCGAFIDPQRFVESMLPDVNKTYFLTYKEAEAKLKELKGK